MKRLIGYLIASIIGGFVTIGIYKLSEEKPQPIAIVAQNQPDKVRTVSTSYIPGSIDFTEAAQKTVSAVVHVKNTESIRYF